MSEKSYIRGFCKAAEAYGVDPVKLLKYAAGQQTPAYQRYYNQAMDYAGNAWNWLGDAYKKYVPFGVRDTLGQVSHGAAKVINRTVPSAIDVGARMIGGAGGAIVNAVNSDRKASEQGNGFMERAMKDIRAGAQGFRDGGDSLGMVVKPYSDKVRAFNRWLGTQDMEDAAESHVRDLDDEARSRAQADPGNAEDILDAHHARKLVSGGTRVAGTAAALGPLTDGWGTTGVLLHK